MPQNVPNEVENKKTYTLSLTTSFPQLLPTLEDDFLVGSWGGKNCGKSCDNGHSMLLIRLLGMGRLDNIAMLNEVQIWGEPAGYWTYGSQGLFVIDKKIQDKLWVR